MRAVAGTSDPGNGEVKLAGQCFGFRVDDATGAVPGGFLAVVARIASAGGDITATVATPMGGGFAWPAPVSRMVFQTTPNTPYAIVVATTREELAWL